LQDPDPNNWFGSGAECKFYAVNLSVHALKVKFSMFVGTEKTAFEISEEENFIPKNNILTHSRL